MRPGMTKHGEYVTTSLTPEQYAFVQRLSVDREWAIAAVVRWLIQQAYEQTQPDRSTHG